jgi:hypothetical protein
MNLHIIARNAKNSTQGREDARMKWRIVLWMVCLLTVSGDAGADEFGVNIHGFSYHPDRRDSSGMKFREFNPGVGAHLVVHESERHIWLTEGGIYRNSSGHISKYAGAGYRFKLPAGFRLGPSVVFYQSPDQNSGKAFIAPLLVFSFRYQRAIFHIVPVPRYQDVNRNAAIGFYLTMNLWSF